MRTIAVVSALLLALLLVAAPLAVAGGEAQAEKGKTKAAEAKALRHAEANETDSDEDAAAAAATGAAGEGKGKDKAAAAEHAGKRRHAVDALLETLASWRDAWTSGAAEIREGCRAEAPDRENATKEEKRAWAHCVRDGYHALFDALKLERKAWKADVKALRA